MLDNILLIDDDSTTNHVNRRLLLRSGKVRNVHVVESGTAAMAYLSGLGPDGNSPRPDLILLDLKMTGMDGFDFLDAYTRLPEEKKARLMICLTSSASFYDLDRLKNYPDVADHFYKPLTNAHITNLVNQVESNQLPSEHNRQN